MRRRVVRSVVLAAVAMGCVVPGAPADSIFGIRGLGLLGRPLSARAAGTGGGFALFDAASALNPAASGLWRAPAGWAVGSPTWRTYDDGTTSTALGATRFPLFGVAVPAGRRLVVAVSVGEYLDRTWGFRTERDTVIRDTAVTMSDDVRSIGGVSDLRFAVSYALSDRVLVGLGLHALAGSSQIGVLRQFLDSAGTGLEAFAAYQDLAVTDITGTSVSAGVQVRASSKLALSGMVRLNSRLTVESTRGATARIGMPVELGIGAFVSPGRGLSLGASAGYQTWSRASDALVAAGQAEARDVWSLAVGAEFDAVRFVGRPTPLRVGYHWRQLPFSSDGEPLSESAFSGGLGIDFAGGRATLDFGTEIGTRRAGGQRERFTTAFVGVLVRP